jgi:endonuclease G
MKLGIRSCLFVLSLTMFPIIGCAANGGMIAGNIKNVSSEPSCVQNALDNQFPNYGGRVAIDAKVLCYGEMTIMHSKATRTPLWVVEKTNPKIFGGGKDNGSVVTVFHAETALPSEERAELDDYKNSDFDRGLLAPRIDFSSDKSKSNCFSLANVAPLIPFVNRSIWSKIQFATHKLALSKGEIFVVTGVLFMDENLRLINGRVAAPSHFWKAIYVPATGQSGVYVVENIQPESWHEMSISDFEKFSNVVPFPSMQTKQKIQPSNLPNPTERH